MIHDFCRFVNIFPRIFVKNIETYRSIIQNTVSEFIRILSFPVVFEQATVAEYCDYKKLQCIEPIYTKKADGDTVRLFNGYEIIPRQKQLPRPHLRLPEPQHPGNPSP